MTTEKDTLRASNNESPTTRRKPLVEYCTNPWRTDPKWNTPAVVSTGDYGRLERFFEKIDPYVDKILDVIKAPKFRRLLLSFIFIILSAVLLWIKMIGPWIVEEKAAWASLSRNNADNSGGLFGTNARPRFPGMIQVAQLDSSLLPNAAGSKRRLIFIGDIHGCKKELEALLEKVHFNTATDHIVAAGDILDRGPDSLGVIDLLRTNKASCVRGNHEDRILQYAGHARGTSLRPGKKSGKKTSSKQHEGKKLAKELSHDQLSYLRSFPLALRIGNIRGIGDMIVVHAGLVPGLPIDSQDPSSIMNMRIIDLKTHVPSKKHQSQNSIPWFKLWNKFQRLLPAHSKLQTPTPGLDSILTHRTTIVYGHDSRRGLQIGKYTKGLDSGCVKGGKLTALVLSEGGRQDIVQVGCQDHTIKADLNNVLQGRAPSSSDEDD